MYTLSEGARRLRDSARVSGRQVTLVSSDHVRFEGVSVATLGCINGLAEILAKRPKAHTITLDTIVSGDLRVILEYAQRHGMADTFPTVVDELPPTATWQTPLRELGYTVPDDQKRQAACEEDERVLRRAWEDIIKDNGRYPRRLLRLADALHTLGCSSLWQAACAVTACALRGCPTPDAIRTTLCVSGETADVSTEVGGKRARLD
jgi:hypothetical protein